MRQAPALVPMAPSRYGDPLVFVTPRRYCTQRPYGLMYRGTGLARVQLMSAGSGVTHSEFNASDTEVFKLSTNLVVPDSLAVGGL